MYRVGEDWGCVANAGHGVAEEAREGQVAQRPQRPQLDPQLPEIAAAPEIAHHVSAIRLEMAAMHPEMAAAPAEMEADLHLAESRRSCLPGALVPGPRARVSGRTWRGEACEKEKKRKQKTERKEERKKERKREKEKRK